MDIDVSNEMSEMTDNGPINNENPVYQSMNMLPKHCVLKKYRVNDVVKLAKDKMLVLSEEALFLI